MNFTQAIISGFRKCVTFSGRASRSEFWYWFLFFVIFFIVDAAVFDALFKGTKPFHGIRIPYDIIELVFCLTAFPACLAVTIRRLHDVNHRGWWVLIHFIPYIGAIILLLWFCDEGTQGTNRFGADPLPVSDVPRAPKKRWKRIVLFSVLLLAAIPLGLFLSMFYGK